MPRLALFKFCKQWLECRRLRKLGYTTLQALYHGNGATPDNKDFYINHYRDTYGKDSIEYAAFCEGWMRAVEEEARKREAK